MLGSREAVQIGEMRRSKFYQAESFMLRGTGEKAFKLGVLRENINALARQEGQKNAGDGRIECEGRQQWRR